MANRCMVTDLEDIDSIDMDVHHSYVMVVDYRQEVVNYLWLVEYRMAWVEKM